jgi:cobalamin biosynthesis Mg chelatase CobN
MFNIKGGVSMGFKLFIGVLVILLFSFSAVSGALSDKDKSAVLKGIESYKDDSVKMNLFLAVTNAKIDLSDNPALRQQLVDAATKLGIDLNRYPNVAQGIVPLAVKQEEAAEQAESVIENAKTESSSPANKVSTPSKPSSGVQVATDDSGSFSTGSIVLLIVIIVILISLGWFYGKKKGAK